MSKKVPLSSMLLTEHMGDPDHKATDVIVDLILDTQCTRLIASAIYMRDEDAEYTQVHDCSVFSF
jgi:hypothetical protein